MAAKTSAAIRAALVVLMDGTVKNEPSWHYAVPSDHDGGRTLPFPTRQQALTGVVDADCSLGCSILCRLGGAPDPTGDGWLGNSSSMYHHLEHVTLAQAKVADIAVLGRVDGEQHAVMIRRKGKTFATTTCWSHGQEKGPLYTTLQDELDAHPGATITILRAVPADKPAPAKPKPKPAPAAPVAKVDVAVNGTTRLTGQKATNPAMLKRVAGWIRTAKTVVVRKRP